MSEAQGAAGSYLCRLAGEALGAEDELLRQLPIGVVVLAGDGLVPLGLLTLLHTLTDDGLALQHLHTSC